MRITCVRPHPSFLKRHPVSGHLRLAHAQCAQTPCKHACPNAPTALQLCPGCSMSAKADGWRRTGAHIERARMGRERTSARGMVAISGHMWGAKPCNMDIQSSGDGGDIAFGSISICCPSIVTATPTGREAHVASHYYLSPHRCIPRPGTLDIGQLDIGQATAPRLHGTLQSTMACLSHLLSLVSSAFLLPVRSFPSIHILSLALAPVRSRRQPPTRPGCPGRCDARYIPSPHDL